MARITVKELGAGELAPYAAWLAASPQGTVFAGSAWLAALAGALPGRVYALAFEADGRTRALAPVWETRRPLLGRVAAIPPLTPYWGPALPPEEGLRPERRRARDHEALAAVAAELGRRYPYARVACHPALPDVRPFLWAGWRAEVRFTAVIPPLAEEAYLASLGSDTRSDVKRAARLTVEESDDPSPLAPLAAATFARQRMTPPAPAALWDALGALARAGTATAYYLRDEEGRVVAGHVVIHDARAAYNLAAASDPAARAGGGAYLFYRVIRAAAARGLPLDVVGINVPAVAAFKEQFTGALTPYYVLTWCRTPAVRVAAALGRRRPR